ncbi:MAG: hypothetical protein Q9220_007590 [cf. Caloplaca sp. 1 TL-2023]
MFQRLKGAIDSRIAEEQARQRSALISPPPDAVRKSSSRAASPAKRVVRSNAPSRLNGEISGKGPDPSDFEPEFAIDESDVPSRSSTPRPAPTKHESSSKATGEESASVAGNGEEKPEKASPDGPSEISQELPTDVRVKLRKLEKLESRYHELLRSYKVAHSRVQTIDTFETSLRENTPLTSISDPRALVEYLNQLNLKGDLVVDELKRVSHDRDTYKEQVHDAEQRAREAWDEVTNLRQAKNIDDSNEAQPGSAVMASAAQTSPKDQPFKPEETYSSTVKSPASTTKSRTGSLTSLSIFSPKVKPVESPLIKEVSEDLFSYDDEIPRLQQEVKDRDVKIEGLEKEVNTLQGDLAVTRESTQSMVQTLEEATRELNHLRDYKDRSAVESEEQTSKQISDQLRAELTAVEAKLQDEEIKTSDGKAHLAEVEQRLSQANKELAVLREDSEKPNQSNGEIENLRQKLTSLKKEASDLRLAKEQEGRKVYTLNALMKNVRDQLVEEERKHTELRESKEVSDGQLRSQISRMEEDLEAQRRSQPVAIEAVSRSLVSTGQIQGNNENSERTTDPASAGKKRNKKKKKGGPSAGEQTKEISAQPHETTATGASHVMQGTPQMAGEITMLQDELNKFRGQLEDKSAALEKARSKMKDQDDLKEEIESLRDDLINVGQEHVAAKDRIKELQAEKQALQSTIAELERNLTDSHGSHASSNALSHEKHQDLTAQFEDLKTRASTLQSDLSGAQQLASSRFKELSDMRAMMQKAQPELASLRSEISELRSIKEGHDQQRLKLDRAEAKQAETLAELAKQKQILAERDTQMKNISQKLSQERDSKNQAEDARSKANQDIQRLESDKKRATESIDQLSRDLSRTRDEMSTSRNKLKEIELQITQLKRDNAGLKEEIELKTAQHASAQSLMSSMRDQTSEMAVQLKEARDRCDGLDEEVADAHRLLNERSREAETMRRLLADVEGQADARTRDMKERMEVALEERDRAEDEASTATRRRARELDDLKTKVREAERDMKRAEQDKEELDTAQREWKRQREGLEHRSDQSVRDAEAMRHAMGELRDTLDESERQARDAEKQKAELRRSVEETQHRLEKLQRANKSMADEIRTIQTSKTRGIDSEAQSSRSSTDSAPAQARLASPAPSGIHTQAARPVISNGQTQGSMDFVYLKNVLLQFLEQKDKNHQKQLIPVLGMLLHFDRKDEQRWMSAITSK